MENQEAPKAIKRSQQQVIQLVKEVVTAILGIMILVFTLVLIARTFGLIDLGDEEKLAEGKEILQILLGLAGVVLGYYFGKVPADAQAARARDEANAANERSRALTARAGDLAEELDAMLDLPSGEKSREAMLNAPGTETRVKAEKVRDELRSLSRLGGRG